MAARRPGSSLGRVTPKGFAIGANVEYFSQSYDEWIEAIVSLVRPDGTLKLLHEDGSVLKESAPPTLCRLITVSTPEARQQSGACKGSRGNGGSASVPSPKAAPKATPKPAVGKASVLSGGRAQSAFSVAPIGGLGINDALSSTINPRRLWPGDKVKLKESGREGEVMYVGWPSFAMGEVVGVRLFEKRSKSDCDGKAPTGERFFRCAPGFGVFTPSDDVEVMPRVLPDGLACITPPMEQLDVEAAFADLVGLVPAEKQLSKVRQLVEVQRKREGLGVFGGKPLHWIFRGPRGTGMSTVTQLLAHLLRDLEVLVTGHVVEVSRKDLVPASGSHGDTEKLMNKLWDSALGGVLMINDVHLLHDRSERSRDDQGLEACEFLSKQLDLMARRCSGEHAGVCWPQVISVVVTLPMDSPLPEALQHIVMQGCDFREYTIDELAEILSCLVVKRKFSLSKDISMEGIKAHIRKAMSCGGSGLTVLQRLLDDAITRQTERVWATETVSLHNLTMLVEEDFLDILPGSHQDGIKTALAKLDNVVGLKGVKTFIHGLHAQLKTEIERREAGIAVSGGGVGTLHMIFTGNPGTGKTTVARIVAELLSTMGLLRKGHLVEADRGTLVAGFCGQTALKTRQVVEQALGGVLFVDEAYALVSEDGKDAFGHEALDTLIKIMEDRRQDLVVILAGYPEEMQRFIKTNPGVRSRFPVSVEFEDYIEEELMQIAEKMLLDDVLVLSHGATQALAELLQRVCKGGHGREQGNGRAVRNILEQAKRRMAVRLQSEDMGRKRSQTELCTLEATDFL